MAIKVDKDWRKKEESYGEIVKKYPTISPFIITQIDVQRRGVEYTRKALDQVDKTIHQTGKVGEADIPVSLLLRDGTSICTSIFSEAGVNAPLNQRDRYLVDVVDDRIVLVDEDQVIDEVFYWEKPRYFDKLTSNGTPMGQVVDARPQRFHINMNKYCHFWDTPGHGCKYCGIGASGQKFRGCANELVNFDEVREVMQEIIKEKGRFTGVVLTGGSILSGDELLDDELEGYIKTLQAVGTAFSTKKFPSQVNSTAFNERQLIRLYEETGLTSYTTDFEVFDEKLYQWICPGKAHYLPHEEVKKRLYKAVEIFGKGQVNTGIVSGVEMAEPQGYQSEQEALKMNFEFAEELASHGVGLKHDVWNVVPGSIFFRQSTPSLDYYVHLTKGFYEIMCKYGISTEMDNYRKCGMHASINMDRI
ncbi:MAG: radical SAM protein [Lachnospiraceae bacterium]|nr:radical SAM protein [Lachnospiraceae bacterium]